MQMIVGGLLIFVMLFGIFGYGFGDGSGNGSGKRNKPSGAQQDCRERQVHWLWTWQQAKSDGKNKR